VDSRTKPVSVGQDTSVFVLVELMVSFGRTKRLVSVYASMKLVSIKANPLLPCESRAEEHFAPSRRMVKTPNDSQFVRLRLAIGILTVKIESTRGRMDSV